MRRIWPGRCEIINIIEERKTQPSETGSNYEDSGSSRIVISQQTRPVHRPIQSNPIGCRAGRVLEPALRARGFKQAETRRKEDGGRSDGETEEAVRGV
jgi:hypothetical protein